MRFESSVTSVSWIPSEAVTGVNKAAFGTGFTHYDAPPPEVIDDLDALRDADRFRFANALGAWIETDDEGAIVGAGYSGRGVMGATTLRVGSKEATFAAVQFDVLQQPVEIGATFARFVQTSGGHTAVPAPRIVKHAPFVAFEAPTVWTTLSLVLHADGRAEYELVGASPFPRHWVYDADGTLVAKAGLADFKEWWKGSFGRHTPWGDEDSPQLVTEVETALERELSTHIMRGGHKPTFHKVRAGAALTVQGEVADDVFLLLNGVVSIEVDGEPVAQLGPGAILGERSGLEGGRRTSTARAVTDVKVAVARADEIERSALVSVSEGHRRESGPPVTGS